MQTNETLRFNQSENASDPAWKALDTVIRGWVIKRKHDETLEAYDKLKKETDATH